MAGEVNNIGKIRIGNGPELPLKVKSDNISDRQLVLNTTNGDSSQDGRVATVSCIIDALKSIKYNSDTNYFSIEYSNSQSNDTSIIQLFRYDKYEHPISSSYLNNCPKSDNPNFGDYIYVPYFETDQYGHITSMTQTSKTQQTRDVDNVNYYNGFAIKIPNTKADRNNDGLLSFSDYQNIRKSFNDVSVIRTANDLSLKFTKPGGLEPNDTIKTVSIPMADDDKAGIINSSDYQKLKLAASACFIKLPDSPGNLVENESSIDEEFKNDLNNIVDNNNSIVYLYFQQDDSVGSVQVSKVNNGNAIDFQFIYLDKIYVITVGDKIDGLESLVISDIQKYPISSVNEIYADSTSFDGYLVTQGAIKNATLLYGPNDEPLRFGSKISFDAQGNTFLCDSSPVSGSTNPIQSGYFAGDGKFSITRETNQITFQCLGTDNSIGEGNSSSLGFFGPTIYRDLNGDLLSTDQTVNANESSPKFGDNLNIAKIVFNKKGKATSVSGQQITIPNSVATQTESGLMSSTDKKDLDDLVTEYDKIAQLLNEVIGTKTI